ncbi:hypothetical protein DV738_g3549, partial [Chaetothyriales sp. CBS 135597]
MALQERAERQAMRQRGAASRTVDQVDFGLRFGTPQSQQRQTQPEDGDAQPSAAKRRRISGPVEADNDSGSIATEAVLVGPSFSIASDRDSRRSTTSPPLESHDFDKENGVPELAQKKTKRKRRKSVIPAALRKKKRSSTVSVSFVSNASVAEEVEEAALQSFSTLLRSRLLDMSSAVSRRRDLETRMRRARRDHADLQARWLAVRGERERLALKCERVREWHRRGQRDRHAVLQKDLP